jgi:hypothetical protein
MGASRTTDQSDHDAPEGHKTMTMEDPSYKRFLDIHDQGKRNQKELLSLALKLLSTVAADLGVPNGFHRPLKIEPFPGWTRLNDNAALSPEGAIALGIAILIEKGDGVHPDATISLLVTISRDRSGTFVQLQGGNRHAIDANNTRSLVMREASEILAEQVFALTRFSSDLFVAS